jgi:hypothetical protein
MKDKFVRWDNPPTLDGMTGHAGCLPNCKCWSEVQIPDPQKQAANEPFNARNSAGNP